MGKSPLRDSKTEVKNTYDKEMHRVASVTDDDALDITGKYDPEYDKRTDKEYIDPDTNEPPVQMKSPLHGYVEASDMVDPSPPTAHMWNKVFDSFTQAYKDVVTPKDPCEGLTGDSLAKCRNKQYETKSAGTGENISKPKQEAPKDTSAYANLPDDYDSEIHKAGFDKDNKRVLKDAEGNTYAKYDATSNQWVHVDSVQDFG